MLIDAPAAGTIFAVSDLDMIVAFERYFGEPRIQTVKPIWYAFLAAQFLDGLLTSIGLQVFGASIEANPLILWYADTVGPLAAVWGAKLFAVACGVILHCRGRHDAIAALTAFYCLCAITPWGLLLATI